MNCINCEGEGVKTALVWAGPYGCCPIHSAKFLAELDRMPDGFALVRKPVLTDKGVPSR